MSAIITPECPDGADAVVLIAELEAHLEPFYPASSRHGYSVEKLPGYAVAFFVLRNDGTALRPAAAASNCLAPSMVN